MAHWPFAFSKARLGYHTVSFQGTPKLFLFCFCKAPSEPSYLPRVGLGRGVARWEAQQAVHIWLSLDSTNKRAGFPRLVSGRFGNLGPWERWPEGFASADDRPAAGGWGTQEVPPELPARPGFPDQQWCECGSASALKCPVGGTEAVTGGGASGLGARGSPPRGLGTSVSAAVAGSMASTALEIIAFVVSISGWVLVSSTLPTDYWKVSTIDGTVITTATYFANLWKMCVTDSTGVANCKDFPSMLALDGLHPFGTPSPSLSLAGFPSGRILLWTHRGTPGGGEAGLYTLPREGPQCPLSGCPVGRLLSLRTPGGEA